VVKPGDMQNHRGRREQVDIAPKQPQIPPESETQNVSGPRQPIERPPPVDVRQPAEVREGVSGPEPDRGVRPGAPAGGKTGVGPLPQE
jgi:hypothetical protein